MSAIWRRRGLCHALLMLGTLVMGCDPTIGPEGHTPEYSRWARAQGLDHTPGFPCGPFGGGLPRTDLSPPPHSVSWSPDGTQIIFDDITRVQVVDANATRATAGCQFESRLSAPARGQGARRVLPGWATCRLCQL